jgi:hypothetical protein
VDPTRRRADGDEESTARSPPSISPDRPTILL